MTRSILLLAAALSMCSCAIGCHACQGTYDYCGPMPDEPCDFFYRRNSILGGDMNVQAPEGETPPAKEDDENVPTPAPEQQNGGLQYMPSPTPMPPDGDFPPGADQPSESESPPDSGQSFDSEEDFDTEQPLDTEQPPDSDSAYQTAPPPGARLQPDDDPYEYRPQRSRGLLGSLFHSRGR